ncbi:ABC transporter ATP-binding protein [Flindersiella endophytica]
MRIPLAQYWNLLARYLKPHRRLLVLLAALIYAAVAARLLTPWFAAKFLDTVTTVTTTPAPLRHLTLLATAFCAAGIADQALSVLATRIGAAISWQATNELRTDLVAHCLRLDEDFHHRNPPGTMVERIDGDVRQLNNFFSHFSLRLLANLSLVAGILGVTLWVDWRLGLVFVAFAAAALWTFARIRGLAAPRWERARQASADLYGEVEERFGGLPDIRANGAVGYVERRFATALRTMVRRERQATGLSAVIGSATNLTMVLGGILLLATAVVLYRAGAISIGTVFAMSMYVALIGGPLRQILRELDDLQQATAGITRVQELLGTRPAIVSGPGADLGSGAPHIRFDHVSFGYPASAGRPALSDLSFDLPPGEVLGLVGRTGAGKSTIARLLVRLYDPTEGRITFNGVDLRQATLSQLRARIGVVSQDVQLFHATIRDNLTLFAGGVSDQKLVELLCDIGLGGWYERQPDGLDTVLTQAGRELSAGQAQLLAVARVFVADPGLVILDEPTSRLDPAAEALVQQAFNRLFERRTGVVIAHRRHTLRRADTILDLDARC